jgi:hypothetical protein
MQMEKYSLSYAAEATRSRVWQESAIAAMRSLISAHPPTRDALERAPAGVESYARDIARAAYAIADEMHKQHGPSVSGRLQKEDPFVAVESGGTD